MINVPKRSRGIILFALIMAVILVAGVYEHNKQAGSYPLSNTQLLNNQTNSTKTQSLKKVSESNPKACLYSGCGNFY